jgi:hypothetical protein
MDLNAELVLQQGEIPSLFVLLLCQQVDFV